MSMQVFTDSDNRTHFYNKNRIHVLQLNVRSMLAASQTLNTRRIDVYVRRDLLKTTVKHVSMLTGINFKNI